MEENSPPANGEDEIDFEELIPLLRQTVPGCTPESGTLEVVQKTLVYIGQLMEKSESQIDEEARLREEIELKCMIIRKFQESSPAKRKQKK